MTGLTLYTVGHSNHSFEVFIELLGRFSVRQLVDVGSQPYSKWVAHFSKAPLARALEEIALGYHFFGRELGGRPEGAAYYGDDGRLDCGTRAVAEDFLDGIERLVALAQTATTALMCAEEDPTGCHRARLLAPVLRERGITLLHIRGDGRLEPDRPLETAPEQLRLL
ncbi:MAG: DUF488 domain-containing protein [Myxococcales bacterium]|nr:DUF488 domain-containing protein [Myxococcales bacterium]